MQILSKHNTIPKAPSHETCIQWNLKVGLYKLQRDKRSINGWCWIVDHVLGSGPLKCLAVLGIPTNVLQERKDLTLSLDDVEPFGLIPMSHTTGKDVNKALLQISARKGIIPRNIVSDHGSDLWLGIKHYCKEQGNKTVEHYDVCHKVAIELKKLFTKDPLWSKFCGHAAQAKRELYNTDGVCYAPPNQRRKSRYQNTDILISWACKTLACKEQIPFSVLNKLKWVFDYQEAIAHWQQWIEIGQETRNEIRQRGFGDGAEGRLIQRLLSIKMTKISEILACNFIDYIAFESDKLSCGERSFGSTEVIESLFGYYKYTQAGLWDSCGGIGRLILTMASRVGELSKELVQTALEAVRIHDVRNWLKNSLVCL
jgi:hypothetical protein